MSSYQKWLLNGPDGLLCMLGLVDGKMKAGHPVKDSNDLNTSIEHSYGFEEQERDR